MNGAFLTMKTNVPYLDQQATDIISSESRRVIGSSVELTKSSSNVSSSRSFRFLLQACRVRFGNSLSLNGLGLNRVDEVMHNAQGSFQFVLPKLCMRPMHSKAPYSKGQGVLYFGEGGHETRGKILFRGRGGLSDNYIEGIRRATRDSERTHAVAEEKFCVRIE